MTDLVPVEVTVKVNEVVKVDEAVELAVVFCKLVPEVDPVEVAVLLDDVFLVHDCGCDWPFRFRMM